jgi:hypothetical protein
MELTFLSAAKYRTKLKATVHATGKLGFSEPTANALKITKGGGIKIGKDANGDFFLVYCPEADEECFKIKKAGLYYYANTKGLFDDLGVDYKSYTVIYDLVKVEPDIYSMNKRILMRKNKKAENAEF